MRELRSKPGMPVWRQDENGRSIILMITRAGRDSIGLDEGEKEAVGRFPGPPCLANLARPGPRASNQYHRGVQGRSSDTVLGRLRQAGRTVRRARGFLCFGHSVVQY